MSKATWWGSVLAEIWTQNRCLYLGPLFLLNLHMFPQPLSNCAHCTEFDMPSSLMCSLRTVESAVGLLALLEANTCLFRTCPEGLKVACEGLRGDFWWLTTSKGKIEVRETERSSAGTFTAGRAEEAWNAPLEYPRSSSIGLSSLFAWSLPLQWPQQPLAFLPYVPSHLLWSLPDHEFLITTNQPLESTS